MIKSLQSSQLYFQILHIIKYLWWHILNWGINRNEKVCNQREKIGTIVHSQVSLHRSQRHNSPSQRWLLSYAHHNDDFCQFIACNGISFHEYCSVPLYLLLHHSMVASFSSSTSKAFLACFSSSFMESNSVHRLSFGASCRVKD